MTGASTATSPGLRRLGRCGFRGFGFLLLPVSAGKPATAPQGKGRYRNLSPHTFRGPTVRAIMKFRGGQGLELLFRLPTGLAAVFVKRHGFLVVETAFRRNL